MVNQAIPKTRVEVVGLALDQANNSPIVLLREEVGERLLPIWIGIIEASAIAFELERVSVQRPMTHDLMVQAFDRLGARVLDASIVDLKDNTYIAELRVLGPDGEFTLDARPSDALALALRARVPIYCSVEVLERVRDLSREVERQTEKLASEQAARDGEAPSAEEDTQPKVFTANSAATDLNNLLERLGENDFGKYKM